MSGRGTLLAGAIAVGCTLIFASCGSASGHSSGTTGTVASSSGPPPGACGQRGSHTLAANRLGRIFSSSGVVYACNTSGKRFRLGLSMSCLLGAKVSHVVVAGEEAAFALIHCGTDAGSTAVVVRRLSDGRYLHDASSVTGPRRPESFDTLDSLILRPNGSVAWIAESRSIVKGPLEREVHRADAAGQALLDSGANIGARSLRLHGSTITWTHGGSPRSARLP